MEKINIVQLIETNPVTKLSNDYNKILLSKVKSHFADFEQQLFLASFYCYINYDSKKDFTINLDDVWEWLGFSSKQKCKLLLENNFVLDKDYIIQAQPEVKQQKTENRGGHNKKYIYLNVRTFKSMCLKAGTKKADEIHEYYLKLEELIQDTINEECVELKQQLDKKSQMLDEKSQQLDDIVAVKEKEKQALKEKTIIEQFPVNTQCIYIGLIDNKTVGRHANETVVKFGQSNDLRLRVSQHKSTYSNFRLHTAFKVKNKIEIENCIKKHPVLKTRLRIIEIDDTAHRELIALDDNDFTLEKVEQFIKDIIKEREYNLENYNRLLIQCDELQKENDNLNNILSEKVQQIDKNEKKIRKLETDVVEDTKGKIASHYAICKYGYFLYAFEYENMRYVCSITRQKELETIQKNLTDLYPNGKMIYKNTCTYPLAERNMTFILKQNAVGLGQNKFECAEETVIKCIDAAVKMEEVLIEQSKDVDSLLDFFSNKPANPDKEYIDPETPQVRKAKRAIDQINANTGDVIATYQSIEEAGRSVGLTTGTAIGTALRENRTCRGFIWRYAGFSKEDALMEKPVIKICCKTGERTCFSTIADAAKDCKVSAPALRRRIMTDVHVNNHHWVFESNK